MKTPRFTSTIRSTLVAGTIVLAIATNHSVLAQSSYPLAKANIPFAFQAGDRLMPAGTYQIDSHGGPLLLLRSNQGTAFVLTHAAVTSHPTTTGRVVFERYGTKYFLRQVWTGSSSQGAELPKSRAEKEILKAINNQVASSTEIALNTQR
jgi:hypothetical protein